MINKILPKDEFVRNVLTLMTGVSIAQIIPIAITPILTRIYSPEDFGLFSIFIGITSIVSVAATGRYELAINIPKEDKEAFHIFILSILISCIFCFSLMCGICIFDKFNVSMQTSLKMGNLIYLLPLSILFTSFYQSLTYWNNRKKNYKRLAINRVLQSNFIGGIQLGLSLIFNLGKYGLVLGDILGRFLSSLLITTSMIRDEKSMFFSCKLKSLFLVAKRFQKFPKYLIIAHGINTSSIQLPVFCLDLFFGNGVVGCFALTIRVLSGPLLLISTPISDVFRQRAAEDYVREGNCYNIYVKTFKKLLLISTIIFFPFYFAAPLFFGLVFGEEWSVAGEYAQLMTPMLALGFVTTPLSLMFLLAERQRLDLIFQIFLLLGVLLSFSVSIYTSDPKVPIFIYSIFRCIWYLANLYFTHSFAKGRLTRGEKSTANERQESDILC